MGETGTFLISIRKTPPQETGTFILAELRQFPKSRVVVPRGGHDSAHCLAKAVDW